MDAIYLTAEENVNFLLEAVDEKCFLIPAIDKAEVFTDFAMFKVPFDPPFVPFKPWCCTPES